MLEDFGTACKNFQNLAAELVERLQSRTPCTESGPFNFVMFDQSGGKGRIFLHPARLVQELPTASSSPPVPSSPDTYEDGCLQKMKDGTLRTSDQAECDLQVRACRDTATWPNAAFEPKDDSDEQNRNQILTNSFPEEVYSAFRASEEESSQPAGGYLYENADDDIAALLGCSDEEGSFTADEATSLLTCHFDLAQEEAEPSSRKRGYECEEEVDSRFLKRQRSQEELDDEVDDICDETYSSSLSVVDACSGDSLGPSCLQEDSEGDCQELDESALELQMLCDDFNFEMPEDQQCSSCSKEDGEEGDTISSGSARKSRRDKIKKTVKLLRNIIPGGNCMDTAIVLDEAIDYVKLLQLQVKTLEAKRLVERVR